ncbi:hypothetical protein WUBG_04848 [Wuchereria bancrofti]|uniref:Uncharacterized protein n=1 Tax=Wuchereria bancrofti TaxID=6293 RepID=J9F437_WUCBA|nr:hypothetical protein WUBG_04848 [Wuchereria bancrofti]
MASMTLFARVAATVVMLTAKTNALVCYENDEFGKVYEISNESWDYCVFIPGYEESRVFGIGPEKYDFGQLNPKSAIDPSESVEFIFRCICSYDRCNSATTFSNYLKTIKLDNASSSAEKN